MHRVGDSDSAPSPPEHGVLQSHDGRHEGRQSCQGFCLSRACVENTLNQICVNLQCFQAFELAFKQSVQDFDRLSREPLERSKDVPSLDSDHIPRSMQMQSDLDDEALDDEMFALSSATSVARMGILGGMAGVSMRGMRGMHRRRPCERQSALAARVSNLVDENGHGLLLQMLHVCMRSFPDLLCVVVFMFARPQINRNYFRRSNM